MQHDPRVLLALEKINLEATTRSGLSEQSKLPEFDREHTIRCLDANKHNYHTTCYYLMLIKLQRRGEASPLSQYQNVISKVRS